MSIDDAWRYGTNAWEWLVATPWVMMFAGAALLVTGVYYTIRPVQKSVPPGANVAPIDPLIQEGRLDWDAGGQVVFRGRYLRGGKNVNAYVTYGSSGGVPNGQNRVLGGGKPAVEPRIRIDSVERFDKDAQAAIFVGRVTNVEGNQQVITWGRPELGNISVGITWASYFGCLVLVEEGGKENHYPFAIISRSQEGRAGPPTIVGPPLLSACPNWL